MALESPTYIDYKSMQVGDTVPMPVVNKWEGANQSLFREIQDWCGACDPRPQFEVETIREPGKDVAYQLKRTR